MGKNVSGNKSKLCFFFGVDKRHVSVCTALKILGEVLLLKGHSHVSSFNIQSNGNVQQI